MIRFMILVATWSLTTVGETLFAQALPNRPIDYSDLKPSIDAVETVRLLSADKASALERDVRRAYAALAPSVVRITQPPEHPTGDGSGGRNSTVRSIDRATGTYTVVPGRNAAGSVNGTAFVPVVAIAPSKCTIPLIVFAVF